LFYLKEDNPNKILEKKLQKMLWKHWWY